MSATANNLVTIAAGDSHGLALRTDGHVISWGSVTNVPVDLTNVMAVAGGSGISMALRNDGTVMTWNSAGQTNIPTLSEVKMIAAGGTRALVARFSPLVQYPVDVSKDLLLIYNTNSVPANCP